MMMYVCVLFNIDTMMPTEKKNASSTKQCNQDFLLPPEEALSYRCSGDIMGNKANESFQTFSLKQNFEHHLYLTYYRNFF